MTLQDKTLRRLMQQGTPGAQTLIC